MERTNERVSELERQLRDKCHELEAREASRSRTEALLEDLREHMRCDCRTAQSWLRKELHSQVRSMCENGDLEMETCPGSDWTSSLQKFPGC